LVDHFISVRPSSDFIRVTSSAYSISPPTGSPLAMRVIFIFSDFKIFAI